MEVVVHTILTWASGHREDAVRYVQAQQAATRAMPGCLDCYWTADLDDNSAFHEFERWESAEAFEAHARSGPKFSPEARTLIRRARAYRFDVAATTKVH
ncbi:MAG: antibiotic biosynthesis monooxygenase [Acidimicrobiales bacterium]|nr:antibiotic biosynthesis monooxygenase [Acidimicrobiales bacterium]